MDAVCSVPLRDQHYPKIQPMRAEQAAQERPELSLNPWNKEDERKNEKKEEKDECRIDDKWNNAVWNEDRAEDSGVFFRERCSK